MAERQGDGGITAKRVMEQPPDALVMFSDYAHILSTGNEVILQFYETTPKAPDDEGVIREVTSRLRVTVVLSPAHALNVVKTMQQQLE